MLAGSISIVRQFDHVVIEIVWLLSCSHGKLVGVPQGKANLVAYSRRTSPLLHLLTSLQLEVHRVDACRLHFKPEVIPQCGC